MLSVAKARRHAEREEETNAVRASRKRDRTELRRPAENVETESGRPAQPVRVQRLHLGGDRRRIAEQARTEIAHDGPAIIERKNRGDKVAAIVEPAKIRLARELDERHR